MHKLIKNILLIVILYYCTLLNPIQAQITTEPKSFTAIIPKTITINGTGLSPKSQQFGIPQNGSTSFDLYVSGSEDGESWELTTGTPMGISITYNGNGSIVAVFVSMTRQEDGFTIPQSDIRISPSKIFFSTPAGYGSVNRIFHFNPIIKVSKDTPPGNYVGTITFSVLGQ